MAAIRQRLMERGYTGSYASIWRFVSTLKPAMPPETMTRVETKPGEEAQADSGYAGRMIDPDSVEQGPAILFVCLYVNCHIQAIRNCLIEI